MPNPLSGPLDPAARLVVEEHKDAVVAPTTAYPRPKRQKAMRMGVVDRRGDVVKLSQLWRSYGRMGFPPEITDPPLLDRREVIYAGHLPPHFGHFILEGLSRLWYAAQHPELPIAWGCRSEEPVDRYTRWQHEILDVLGIRNDPVFVDRPVRFSRVHVPQAGFRIKDFFSRQLADFLAVHPARERDPESRIWLSRAGVEAQHSSVFAERLDQVLPDHGWAVIHPERLPIDKQLELLATASHVAAEEGSALHLLVLLRDVRGLQVDILCRRPDRPIEEQNANYQTIADARGFTQRLHVIPEERILGEGYGHVQKVTTTLAGHLEALGVPPAPQPTGEPPSRPLGRALAPFTQGARSYLELGNPGPGVYPGLDVPRRDVVRPAFASDPRRETGAGLQLYEMPLSEFFGYLADPSQPYDLIVIDGLDAAALARSFEASQAVAHAATTWVVCAREDVIADAADAFAGFAVSPVESGEGPCVMVRLPPGARR